MEVLAENNLAAPCQTVTGTCLEGALFTVGGYFCRHRSISREVSFKNPSLETWVFPNCSETQLKLDSRLVRIPE